MPGKEHHGRFRAERRVERADRIGVSRSAGHHGHPRFAGEASPRIRHVHGSRLMAHMHEVELGF